MLLLLLLLVVTHIAAASYVQNRLLRTNGSVSKWNCLCSQNSCAYGGSLLSPNGTTIYLIDAAGTVRAFPTEGHINPPHWNATFTHQGATVWDSQFKLTHNGKLLLVAGESEESPNGSSRTMLYAVDTETGHVSWNFTVPGASYFYFGVSRYSSDHDGTIYVSNGDMSQSDNPSAPHMVYSLRENDGALRWSTKVVTTGGGGSDFGWHNTCVESMDGNSVFVPVLSFDASQVVTLNGADGKIVRRSKSIPGPISTPTVSPDGERMFVGQDGGLVRALSTSDSSQLWTFQSLSSSNPGGGQTSTTGGHLFLSNNDQGTLQALLTSSGTIDWELRTNSSGTGCPRMCCTSTDVSNAVWIWSH